MGSLCFETEAIKLCCMSYWYYVNLLVNCLSTTAVAYLKTGNNPLQCNISIKRQDLPRNKFGGDSWGRESKEGLLIKQASLWRCARASSEKTTSLGNAIRSAPTQVHITQKSMHMPDVCFVTSLNSKAKDFVKNDSSLELYFEVFGSPRFPNQSHISA